MPVPPFMSDSPDRLALVIDTATPGGGLALHHAGLLEERRWGSGLKVGSRLIPDLDAMLNNQGRRPAQQWRLPRDRAVPGAARGRGQ